MKRRPTGSLRLFSSHRFDCRDHVLKLRHLPQVTASREPIEPCHVEDDVALVRLEAFEEGLAIAEGVESAIAGMMLGFAPMWATGSVGGIAAFPVLPGIETLTICAETGEASERAVQEVGTRWSEVGLEVEVITPRVGSDLNDALKAGGGAWS